MEQVVKNKKLTYQEYLVLEQTNDERYEYWQGEVFAMAGGTINHNRIGLKIATILLDYFEKKGCKVFANDVKLQLEKENYYVYPDVLLTCDEKDTDAYSVQYPSLIVEVLSKSTETYDRSIKLAQYRKIPSLKYYLLVSQSACSIEAYGRNNEQELFTYQAYETMDDVITLPAINFSMRMQDIYAYITFSPE
jgi:Uma2 family endonuclease